MGGLLGGGQILADSAIRSRAGGAETANGTQSRNIAAQSRETSGMTENTSETEKPGTGQNTAFNEGISGTAETQTQESTAVSTDPAQHTAAEQATIEAYQAAVDEGLRSVLEEVQADPEPKFSRYTISTVSEKQAGDAANILGGDYSGYVNAINTNGIAHILKEHGADGTVDHSMGDLNDLARIGYVLDNYDDVSPATYRSGDQRYSREFRDKNNAPAPMLVYSKKVNGTY